MSLVTLSIFIKPKKSPFFVLNVISREKVLTLLKGLKLVGIIEEFFIILVSAFAGAAGGSITYHFLEEWLTKRRILHALYREVCYNEQVRKRQTQTLGSIINRPYHTASYTVANEKGILAKLPQETYSLLLYVYDFIFAFHQKRIVNESMADDLLGEKLPKLVDKLRDYDLEGN